MFASFHCFVFFFFLNGWKKKKRFGLFTQPMVRGTNDLVNLCRTGDEFVFSHFARLEKRLGFRLDKEPEHLKKALPDRKSRKVKHVMGVSQKEEEAQLAEEELKRSKSVLEKQRQRKQRQASSVALEKSFLEEGAHRADDEAYEKDFVEDDAETGSKKRGREPVQEDSILRAKRGTPSAKEKKEVNDGIQLYDDDDEDLASFIDDDDEEGDVAKGVIGSDDDDD